MLGGGPEEILRVLQVLLRADASGNARAKGQEVSGVAVDKWRGGEIDVAAAEEVVEGDVSG